MTENHHMEIPATKLSEHALADTSSTLYQHVHDLSSNQAFDPRAKFDKNATTAIDSHFGTPELILAAAEKTAAPTSNQSKDGATVYRTPDGSGVTIYDRAPTIEELRRDMNIAPPSTHEKKK